MRKALHRPVEIGLPFRLAQRQALAQRRFVDLDHAGAGGFEIGDLVADRERDLAAGVAARNVVAHERPVEDGHRPGQHRLHRPFCERLRILPPFDRHRVRARHVAEQHRRADVARAIGLHPAVLGEGKAGKLLAEILHHVVALELAMHQHVEPDVFLPAHGARGLVLQERLVGGIAERAPGMGGACIADVGGLRKRADGRGRKARQLEALVLDLGTLGEGAAALAQCRRRAPRSVLSRRRRELWATPGAPPQPRPTRPERPSPIPGRPSALCRALQARSFSEPRTPAMPSGRDRDRSPDRDRSGHEAASRTARSESGRRRARRQQAQAGRAWRANWPARCCGRR